MILLESNQTPAEPQVRIHSGASVYDAGGEGREGESVFTLAGNGIPAKRSLRWVMDSSRNDGGYIERTRKKEIPHPSLAVHCLLLDKILGGPGLFVRQNFWVDIPKEIFFIVIMKGTALSGGLLLGEVVASWSKEADEQVMMIDPVNHVKHT